jgi:High-affinity Fe2+/Pb2+ permease
LDLGTLSSGLLTGLREGVEAALIVSIILAYLARTGNRRSFPRILLGVGLAVALSAALGLALWLTVGGLGAPYEQLFEALTMLLAAGVVTWMLFWMRRQSLSVKGQLQTAVDRALDDGSALALAGLAFVAVIREGIETSLFLVGQMASAQAGATWVVVGAFVGLAVAALIGVGFYRGSRRLDLATFFRYTGILLVFIAAGMVGKATHELIEIGVITFGTGQIVDLGAILPNDPAAGNVLGQFLGAMFGYSATPELTRFVVWLTCLVVVLTLYLRPVKRSAAQVPAPEPAPVPTGSTAEDR